MKLHYHSETLCIELNANPSVDSRIVVEGVVADFDDDGNIVGIDIDHASDKLDLNTLETTAVRGKFR